MQKENRKSLIVSIIMILIFYISWCFTTKAYNDSKYVGGAIAGFLLGLLCYLYLNWKLEKNKNLYSQLHVINLIIVLVAWVALITGILNHKLQTIETIIVALIAAVTFGAEILWIRRTGTEQYKEKLRLGLKIIRDNWILGVLLGIFCLLSVHTGGTSFKWDSGLYYLTCQDLDLFSVSNLAIYGHIAQTFGFLMKLGTVILGDVSTVAFVLNLLLACLSILSFYGILCWVSSSAGKGKIIAASAIYAFCPFTFGLVNYLSLDYYCAMLFPMLIYVTIKRKCIFHFIVALAFCFTKEPAIVIYVFLCVAVFLIKEISAYKEYKCISVKRTLSYYPYWSMVIVGCLWLGTYLLLGPWSAGEGGLVLDSEYIVDKLKVLYIFNFNWLFAILAIIAVVHIIKRGHEKQMHLAALVILPQVAFTIFGCLFKTANHFRYTDTTLYVLILLTAKYLLCIKSNLSKILLGVCVGVSVLASCFTIDPISNHLFTTIPTGNGIMLSTGKEMTFGDMTIYNRQMLGMENVLNKALKDSIESNMTIIFPKQQNNTWYFDGMSDFEFRNEAATETQTFWDMNKSQRCRVKREGANELKIYHVTDAEELQELAEIFPMNTEFSYICIADEGNDIEKELQSSFEEVFVTEYEYKNWKLKRICFSDGK